ncbi:hypothetical protein CTAYLR_001539 [Chrysophaeum taylorii]|uniref:Endonuclease/exonuclease/phosphatase domain-containing protein n=1 Tax=Chrysophaeum taylorii TaxID=2483200 RepID=A0AAD7UD74_9STRA|nr:hypothetical protein CTAYLR_001539 [Chrysophaeum taylorii]
MLVVLLAMHRRALVDVGESGVWVSLREGSKQICGISRASDEPLHKALNRLELSLGKKSSHPAKLLALDESGSQVDGSLRNDEAWRRIAWLSEFEVVPDAPRLDGASCYGEAIVGVPLVATATARHDGRVRFVWFADGEVGEGSLFTPREEHEGLSLRVEARLVDPDAALSEDESRRFVECGRVSRYRPAAWRDMPKLAAGTLRVCSYNLLADKFGRRTPGCPPATRRAPVALGEVLRLNPDVLCLQEVDAVLFDRFWRPQLEAAGYECVFVAKKNNDEGVATCARGRVVESRSVDLSVASTRVGTVGLVTVVRSDADLVVVVGNTHLYYDGDATALRCVQLVRLLEAVDELAPPRVPLVVAGDLNAFPQSAAIELATTGSVSSTHSDFLGFNTMVPPLVESPVGPLASAYDLSGDPQPTHRVNGFVATLDYILYANLHLRGVLPLPPLTEVIPNSDFPSDHLAIVADFTPNK